MLIGSSSGPPHGITSALEKFNINNGSALCLVVAPGGSGKTTLLRSWAQQCRWKVAWVTLGFADNALEHFWAHLVAALESIGLDSRHIKTSPVYAVEHWEHTIELINAILKIPDELALVLDNYHVITTPEIHRGIMFLVDYVPPRMHILIASRTEPPLPLARLRVRRQLVEIGPGDIQAWKEGQKKNGRED